MQWLGQQRKEIVAQELRRQEITISTAEVVKQIYIVMENSGFIGSDATTIAFPEEKMRSKKWSPRTAVTWSRKTPQPR